MNKKVNVMLAGGLGNQLFQLACALSLTEGPIRAISCLCNPRSSNDIADSQYFKFPSRVNFFSCDRNHKLASKTGYLLLSLTQRRNYLNRFFPIRHLTYIICSIILSIHFRQFFYPRVGNGIGFDESLVRKRGNFLVGYFQSYLFLSEPNKFEEFSRIELLAESDTFRKMRERLDGEDPILIHVRLGDYKFEQGFGVLPSSYFLQAYSQFSLEGSEQPIWVFSDENDLARYLLEDLPSKNLELVNTSPLLPAETLELMRGFDKYVISNSTFSWWGAFLSHKSNAKVIFPTPWFESSPDPLSLHPNNWLGINRY
jgi:Glycosyl transferase family 11